MILGLLVILGPCLLVGGYIRRTISRKENERANPGIPPSRVEDGNPIKPPKGEATKGSTMMAFGALLTVIVSPIALGLQQLLSSEFGSKGRLLRIRNRTALPKQAKGAGWHDDTVVCVQSLSGSERETIGEAWHLSARMEQASVAAFSQLSLYLAALGAPACLVEKCHRAALQEIDHARRCYAIARQISGVPWTAGPIDELVDPGPGKIVSFERLAIGSLLHGCLAEGLAARVAREASIRASEASICETLRIISTDEQEHAELAWEILAWCLDVGGTSVSSAVEVRLAKLSEEFTPRMPEFPGVTVERLQAFGILHQDLLGAFAQLEIQETSTRAHQLLASKRLAAVA